MPEESTTPDLVELTRHVVDALSRGDFDAALSFFAPDAVWSGRELGEFEGLATIRGFCEDWNSAYDEFKVELEEVLDLGNGVVFGVVRQNGRPAGSSGHVQMRFASVGVWVGGMVVRVTNYTDFDEARAAAERLATERADV